jgi:L-asparaginase
MGRAFILIVVLLAASDCEAAARSSAFALPKVRMIATGGTIAGGSALSGTDLIKLVPGISTVADVSVEEFSRVGSSRMTSELQYRLALRVNELLAAADPPAGIVITHGTDTLEETAFLLDLFVISDRPVVFAAAQRVPTEPDTDGPRNLLNAVRIAASPGARGMGVLVTLNGEIHAAADVRKTHTIALETFKSPGSGPIGYVDDTNVVLTHKPMRRLTLKTAGVEDRVELLTLTAGATGRLIDAAAGWAPGIVIEVFGRGNAPPAIMGAVERARAKGVIVVFTSRTRGGRVELDYEAKGLGVISGQDLDGLKARMLLIAALPLTHDPALLQSYFDRLGGVSR